MRKIFLFLILSVLIFSCSSTKEYVVENNTQVVSEDEESGDAHYRTTYRKITAQNKTDGKLVAYYTLGVPFIVIGDTIWQTVRVSGYMLGNFFLGWMAADGDDTTFLLPNTAAEKKEYNELVAEYMKTDEYKYRKYRGTFSSAKIVDERVVEEVKWNGDTEVVDSEVNMASSNVDISAKTKRMTKKITIIGSRVGSVFAIVFGIPSYILGYVYRAASQN
ncbi:hypothetical protein [Treponema zioleckii]|uniref:hypothetical protein n=1 Tax=Treponema zioleckii TaxID=331680 RepID=UPI00168BFD9B|nr:hypothetical protein [Treponema zioleckii]